MNNYAQVIDILMSSEWNPRDLMIEIAKRHPKVVVEAAESLARNVPWMRAVDEHLRGEKFIEAIKVWRAATGISLREAKEAVETRRRELGL